MTDVKIPRDSREFGLIKAKANKGVVEFRPLTPPSMNLVLLRINESVRCSGQALVFFFENQL